MSRVVLSLPEAAEGLLAETRNATVLDGRVADVAARLAPEVTRPREEGEPDTEFASRAWRLLLPDRHMAEDAYQLRVSLGWLPTEVARIEDLLRRSADSCRENVFSAVLAGTRANLLLHAERLDALATKWALS